MKTLLVVLILIAGCIGGMSTLAPNTARERNTKVVYLPLAGYYGLTKCVDGEPMVFISSEQSQENMAATLIHELRHVEQRDAFLTCDGWIDKYSSNGHFRIQSEVDAYCTSLNEMGKMGIYPTIGRIQAEMAILEGVRKLDPSISTKEIQSYISRFCSG